jgi:hypothetical protein
MNTKRSTFTLVLLLTVLVVSGCQVATGEQARGWIRYDNQKYGYNLHYPSDCAFGALPASCKEKPPEERAQECMCFINGENPDEVLLQKFQGEGDQQTLASFTVTHYDTPVYNPPPGTDLVEWMNANFSEMFEKLPNETNAEIDEIPAVRIYSPASPMALSYEEIYLIHDDILFRIHMLDVDDEDNRELYDFILPSISFEE